MNMSSAQNFSMPTGGGDPSMHIRQDMMGSQQDQRGGRQGGLDQGYMSFDNNFRPPLNMTSYPPNVNTDSTSPPFHPAQNARPWNMN